MATKTWVGASGASYNTAASWSPSGVPASGDDLVFNMGDNDISVTGSAAATFRNITITGGYLLTFSSSQTYTIQGDFLNIGTNGSRFATGTGTVFQWTGGNAQTFNPGYGTTFHNITINKTQGTTLTLQGALDALATTASTFTWTNGHINLNGNSINARVFTSTGTTAGTDRTLTHSADINVSGVSGTVLNYNSTLITTTVKTGSFVVSPVSGTNALTVTGMGSTMTAAVAAAQVRSRAANLKLYAGGDVAENARNYVVTGAWEYINANSNFANGSYFGTWTGIDGNGTTFVQGTATAGTEVSGWLLLESNKTSYWNYDPRVYRISTVAGGVAAGTVLTNAVVNVSGDVNDAKAAIFDLACQYATHNIGILANFASYNSFILNCSGANSTFNFISVYDDNTVSGTTQINLSSTNGTYNWSNSDTNLRAGTITHTQGTLNLNGNTIYTRNWSTSGGNRTYNFGNGWIVINGSHRDGTNGTGTLGMSTQTASTTLTSDCNINPDGGFIMQSTGTCSLTASHWSAGTLPNLVVNTISGTLTTTSLSGSCRTLRLWGSVVIGTSTTSVSVSFRDTPVDNGYGIPSILQWNGEDPQGTLSTRYLNIQFLHTSNGVYLDWRFQGSGAGAASTNRLRLQNITSDTVSLGASNSIAIRAYCASINYTKPDGTVNVEYCDVTGTSTFNPASGTTTFNYNDILTTELICGGSAGTTTHNLNYYRNGTGLPQAAAGVRFGQLTLSGASTSNIYNLYDVVLTGNTTALDLLFNGGGTLFIRNSNSTVGRFTCTETTITRTINFGTNWLGLEASGVLTYTPGTSSTVIFTSVTTTTQKTHYSGAGGIAIRGSGVSLTTTNIAESNALNILFEDGYSATFSTPVYRNLITVTGPNEYKSGGWFSTTGAQTLTIYGDLLLHYGPEQGNTMNWPSYTFNFSGTDTSVPQYINTNNYFANSFQPQIVIGTANFNAGAPKILSTTGRPTYIKTVNHSAGTLIINAGQSLVCDRFTPTGGVIYAYGDIYANWWDDGDNSSLDWQGSGYVEVGNTISTSVSGWTNKPKFDSGGTNGATEGPNLRVVNFGDSIWTYYVNMVKKLKLANTSPTRRANINIYKGLELAGGNVTNVTTPQAVEPDLDYTSGGYSGPSIYSRNVGGTTTTFVSTTSIFFTVAYRLPNSGVYEITVTNNTNGGSGCPQFYVINKPGNTPGTVGNVNFTGYTSCAGVTHALGVYNGYIGSKTILIDCSGRIVYWADGTSSAFPVPNTTNGNGYWFAVTDGSSTQAMNMDINWATATSNTGYLQAYYIGVNQAPNINIAAGNSGRYLLSSTSNMSSGFYSLSNVYSQTIDLEPRSATLKFTDINLTNESTIVRTNGVNVETPRIAGDFASLELDSGQITLTGSGDVLDVKTIISGETTTAKYSTYFNGTSYITVQQSSSTPSTIINLNNTILWQAELWYWPEQNYSTKWDEVTSPLGVGLLTKRSSQTASTPDWEIAVDPVTQRLEFINGATTYVTSIVPTPDTWNYIRVNYVANNYGNAGGGGGQDGSSVFDGKFSYRGRSGTVVGQSWIEPAASLPVTTNWSVLFDGTDDGLVVADSSNYYFGSNNFTIELWMYNTAFDPSGNMLFEKGVFASGKEFRAYITATTVVFEGNLTATATGTYTTITATTTNSLNTWYHYAFVRSGNTLYILRNGALLTSAAFTGTIFNTTQLMSIGGAADGNNNFITNGYISNFRIISGQALATGAYTAPTSPLTTTTTGWQVGGSPVALTGTVALLTCNSDKFVDSSASQLRMAFRAGVPQITSFSPFGASYYNSVAFNNGSYLQAPNSTDIDLGNGGGDWTVECWFNMPQLKTSGATYLMGMSNGAGTVNKWSLSINTSTGFGYQVNRVGFQTYVSTVSQWINSSYTWEANKWYHIAAVYTSSDTTTRLYVNMQLVGSMVYNASSTTGVLRIGSDGESSAYFQGYISNVRIVKGTAVYQVGSLPTFASISTQPLTAIANTKLLTCQGNGYFDNNTQVTQKTITRSSDAVRIDNFSPFYSGVAPAANAFTDGTIATTGFHGPLQGGTGLVSSLAGAGGGGYWGGSGGGYSESNTMGGGGGGSSYIHSTLASGTIYDGYYNTAGNSTDVDRGTSGNSGAASTVGTDGKVIITYDATTLSYSTAGIYTWVCPIGVTTITTKCWGAGGAGGHSGGWGFGFFGGAGAGVVATVTTIPGNTYYITVGSGGGNISAGSGGTLVNTTISEFGGGGVSSRNNADNRYGGGGGGYSGIFTTNPATQASALVVAGGGGGGGSSRNRSSLSFLTGTTAGSTGTRTFVSGAITSLTHTDNNPYLIGSYYRGYIKDVEINSNTYDLNNTIPTQALTSSTNTLLLTCQNNTLIDNSPTTKTLTATGTLSRHIFSPTAIKNEAELLFTGSSDSRAYITGDIGTITNNKQYTPGSYNSALVPFAGTYSILHEALSQQSTLRSASVNSLHNLNNTTPFTIEFWLYPIRNTTMGSTENHIVNTFGNLYGWSIAFMPTYIRYQVWENNANSNVTVNTTINLNTWYHIAIQSTGTDLVFFVNGQQIGTTYTRPSYTGNDTAGIVFGTYVQNLTYRGNGSWRLSNFRFVRGSTVYNSGNFTPPTTPLTVITDTVFLGLNTSTFVDQTNNVTTWFVEGNTPVVQGGPQQGVDGTGYLELIPIDTSGASITVNTLQKGIGNYSKGFKTPIDYTATLYNEGLVGSVSRWSNKSTYYMTQWADLGSGIGHGPIINTTYTLTHTGLPTHTHVRYRLKWHFIDSVDSETNTLSIDGVTYLQFSKSGTTEGAASITTNLLSTFTWKNGYYSYSPLVNITYRDGYFTIDTGWIPHTASTIAIAHFSGLNEGQTNEATYLTHAQLDFQNNGIDVVPTNSYPLILGVKNFNINGTTSYTNYLVGALVQPDSTATVNVSYVGIRDSVVSGGANQYWFATNSIDYGGNIGWNFGGGQITTQDKSFFFFIIT